ncbi:MAG: CvpA family protein [Clostridiales bacterium]|nr:CvpA family protein [Clostridiales bacterium]
MNTVDIVILGILGISVLVGLYRGFVASVASLGSCLLSLILSFWLNPRLVAWVQSNPNLIQTLMSYTDAGTRIGDQTMAQASVTTLSSGGIMEILNKVNLPGPLNTLLQNNLQGQVFQNIGITRVGDYVSQTIVSAVLNVICFLVCFIVCFLVMHLVLGFLKAVFKFPVLKQMNSLAGGVFGLLRGMLLCFLAFALLPLIQTAVPIRDLDALVSASTLAPLFNSERLILDVMSGKFLI